MHVYNFVMAAFTAIPCVPQAECFWSISVKHKESKTWSSICYSVHFPIPAAMLSSYTETLFLSQVATGWLGADTEISDGDSWAWMPKARSLKKGSQAVPPHQQKRDEIVFRCYWVSRLVFWESCEESCVRANLSCQLDCIWNQLKYKELGTSVCGGGGAFFTGSPEAERLTLNLSCTFWWEPT